MDTLNLKLVGNFTRQNAIDLTIPKCKSFLTNIEIKMDFIYINFLKKKNT